MTEESVKKYDFRKRLKKGRERDDLISRGIKFQTEGAEQHVYQT